MTLSYQDALELRDNGFPQTWHYDEGGEHTDYFCEEKDRLNKEIMSEWISLPTLSELIEACGEEFGMLAKDSQGWCTGWIDPTKAPKLWVTTSVGSSPEQAVKNLWIALQGKK